MTPDQLEARRRVIARRVRRSACKTPDPTVSIELTVDDEPESEADDELDALPDSLVG
jgi:hypothetical protein